MIIVSVFVIFNEYIYLPQAENILFGLFLKKCYKVLDIEIFKGSSMISNIWCGFF